MEESGHVPNRGAVYVVKIWRHYMAISSQLYPQRKASLVLIE